MTKVNNLQGQYDRYLNCTTYENIYKAYNKPSAKKVSAWEYCKKLCNEYNGNNLRVLANNCYFFTAGFTAELDGKKIFVYITKSNDRYMEVE